MEALPDWAVKFNESGLRDEFMNQKWETLYPIDNYTESIEDDNVYESPFQGELKPVFPHNLPALKEMNGGYDLIKSTPFGNSMIVAFAKAAIEGEELGDGRYTDFLALSFSSPDYIGHQFGADSKEVQDNYLRLDRDIADLLSYLDVRIGKGEYTLFLTADHAALPVPAYLKSRKIPASSFDNVDFVIRVKQYCAKQWGSPELIENVSNHQIFLNREKLLELKLSKKEVSEGLVEFLINTRGIHKAVASHTLEQAEFTRGVLSRLQNGYNQKLSGDVLWIPDPVVIGSFEKGSSHGSGYSYDSHVPVIFFGKGIRSGVTSERVDVIDIAPTVSALLKITFPSGSRGRVIENALK
jgi:predicted AlkP superfamily pyrophosphatase or phosphodiesterase